MKKNFRKRYKDLETEVLSALREKVENSTYESESVSSNAILLHHSQYIELVILHDAVHLIDIDSQHVHAESLDMEDLIYILENII